MKILKINDKKGYFYKEKADEWCLIENIDKECLLDLANLILSENEVSFDEYKEDLIGNVAQQIIYKNVYNKLVDLKANKQSILDDIKSKYQDKIDKYKG